MIIYLLFHVLSCLPVNLAQIFTIFSEYTENS